MANAVRYDTKPGVTLNLTMSEARTLVTMFQAVGGHPNYSLRGLVDNIYSALRAEGVRPFGESLSMLEPGRNSLYFEGNTMSYTREDPPGEPT